MEQTLLQARLEVAQRKAKLGQDQIDRAHMAVAELFASGSDITEAENRLRVYQKLHRNYLADVERLQNALNWPQVEIAHVYQIREYPPDRHIRSRPSRALATSSERRFRGQLLG